jgi:tRNA(Ile)-lysidine synthase
MPDYKPFQLDQLKAPLAVAYSGGADSTALLLACAQAFPGQVHAIHIHHGLQAAADGFAAHCEAFCAALGVPLVVKKVQAKNASGQSPEDAARVARYAALAEAVFEINNANVTVKSSYIAIKNVVIGQHADDQAETLLLALSRGAGLPGLAAMPARWERAGLVFHRPLLGVSAAQIRTWLGAKGAAWIEDPTNADTSFTRNHIRHALLPALEQVFPQFRETFARSARHAAQAQELLHEIAAEDMAKTGNPPRIVAIQDLTLARQANLVRYWLKTTHRVSPSAAQLKELLSQIAACTHRGKKIHIKVANGFVERHGELLAYLPLASRL